MGALPSPAPLFPSFFSRARERRVSRKHEAIRVARAASLTNFSAYEFVSASLGIVAAPLRKVPDRSEIVSLRRF